MRTQLSKLLFTPETVKFNEPKNAVFSSTINSFRCGNGIPILFARVDNKQKSFVKSY